MLKEGTADKTAIIKAEVTPELRRRVKVRAAEKDTSVARYLIGVVEQRLSEEDSEQERQNR